MGFARARVSRCEFDRPKSQSVVALRRWQSTMSRCDAVRCDADIGQDGGGALFLTGFRGTVAPLQGRGMASQSKERREVGLVLAVVCAGNP